MLRKSIFALLALCVVVEFTVLAVSQNKKISVSDNYLECITLTKTIEKGKCIRELAKKAYVQYSAKDISAQILSIKDLRKLMFCHEFYHYIGWEIYHRTNSLPNAFIQTTDMCDNGMIHGIVEAYITNTSRGLTNDAFVSRLPSDICTDSVNKTILSNGVIGVCYHGLGHGFMLLTNNNIDQSLSYCSNLSEGAGGCYTGVFMEGIQNKQISLLSHASTPPIFDTTKPDSPCDQLDQRYKKTCYAYKGVFETNRTGGDYRKAFFECTKISAPYQNDCFRGVGSNIPGPHWTSEEAGKACSNALVVEESAYKDCIEGAMSFIVELHPNSPQEIEKFCQQIQKSDQGFCYEQGGKNLLHWISDKNLLNNACNTFTTHEARKSCLRSID